MMPRGPTSPTTAYRTRSRYTTAATAPPRTSSSPGFHSAPAAGTTMYGRRSEVRGRPADGWEAVAGGAGQGGCGGLRGGGGAGEEGIGGAVAARAGLVVAVDVQVGLPEDGAPG